MWTTRDRVASARPARAIEALNFFLADVQAGVGPFVGVILLSRGWSAAAIGSHGRRASTGNSAPACKASSCACCTVPAGSTSGRAPSRPRKVSARRSISMARAFTTIKGCGAK